MNKKLLTHPPSYFDRYISLVPDVDLEEAFENSVSDLQQFEWASCERLGLNVYAPGKWTIPDILQHLLDWERIMSYRALGFARGVLPTAPGHDEDEMAIAAAAHQRPLQGLIQEMYVLRASTKMLFTGMNEAQLLKTGIAFNSELSALGLAYTLLGHQRHHLNVIQERYFPMLS